MSTDLTRTFVCVEIGAPEQAAIAAMRTWLPDDIRAVRSVVATNLHITMRFLGDLSPEHMEAVCRATESTASEFERFEALIGEVGAFPSARRASTIWAGVTEGDEVLANIYQRLEEHLSKSGFGSPDKRFRAHVTLARVRPEIGSLDRRRLADALTAISSTPHRPVPIQVSHLTVMASKLTREGSIYTPITQANLGWN